MSDPYHEFVAARLLLGDDPNDIEHGIWEALREVPDWALWRDGRWRPDFVCATCGSPYFSICGHAPLGLHAILRSEWERKEDECG